MPSPLHTLSPPALAAAPDLAALRTELDRLDEQLHDTLMQRARVVSQVATLGVKGAVPHRPGREAAIIRRLLARHEGDLPPSTIVRIWRELLAGFTAQQRPVLVTVCEAEGDPAYLAAAREHFGALTPLRAYRTPAQAINDVSRGIATAAVLPAPVEGEAPSAAWWTAMLHRDDPRIHVVACLPFWSARTEGSPKVQALVVGAAAPDPSGRDRSLLGLEMTLEVSRARLAAAVLAAGFQA
ncbi:MAG: chorismate mutase, partial [Gemmatimonadaceae bacterium]|nr:chorismate mutase [Acetobacteraceae bacterium]